jgi:hypothetical protein
MTTIKDINKKLTCLIDNNYIEHINLKKIIDELKEHQNSTLEKKQTFAVDAKNPKILNATANLPEILDYLLTKSEHPQIKKDLLPDYIKDEQNLLNFILQSIPSKDLQTQVIQSKEVNNLNSVSQELCHCSGSCYTEKIKEDLNDFIKNIIDKSSATAIATANINKQNLDHIIFEINEEQKNLKKEIQTKIPLCGPVLTNIIKEEITNNKIEEKISKSLNDKIKETDDKILIVRNDTHKNFTNIDKALINLKGDLLSKINSIQKNQETLKFFFCEKVNEIEKKSKETNNLPNNLVPCRTDFVSDINYKKEQDYQRQTSSAVASPPSGDINLVNTQKEIIDKYNLLNEKYEKLKVHQDELIKSISEKNNENMPLHGPALSGEEIINKVDIIISSKFVEMNKNITEFIIKNASDLVFSNKDFCAKIEKWIQSQILQALKK